VKTFLCAGEIRDPTSHNGPLCIHALVLLYMATIAFAVFSNHISYL
jgi:hypothetical protein